MKEFMELLQQHIVCVEGIGDKIEAGDAYLDELRAYLPEMNQMITNIFGLIQHPEIQLQMNQEFLLQVLNDIIYGIEQEDAVFLLDVLRYGLLEVYYYTGTELQGGE